MSRTRRTPRRRNPMAKRLGFVEQQFGDQVADFVLQTVAEAAEDPSPDPSAVEPWEHLVPELAVAANRAFRDHRRGRISDRELVAELDRVRVDFFDRVTPYARVAAWGPALTAKEVRERVESGVDLRGAEFVADLGEGYTAVVATPDLDAPEFPPGDPEEPTQEMADWVRAYAPFQQYMGVSMNNCLQFYRVNYTPYGKGKFLTQRGGGRLYAVLDAKAKPVAATLTEATGYVIETNGIRNRPPVGSDAKALDRLEKIMRWDASARGVFDVPGASPAIQFAIEWVLDNVHTGGASRTDFLERATAAARQDGFDGERVVTAWKIYILVESPYAAITSILSTESPQRVDVASVIEEVVDALRANDHQRLVLARNVARHAANDAFAQAADAITAAAKAAYRATIPNDAPWVAYRGAAAASAAAKRDKALTEVAAEADYADALLRLMEEEAAGRLELTPTPNPLEVQRIKQRLTR